MEPREFELSQSRLEKRAESKLLCQYLGFQSMYATPKSARWTEANKKEFATMSASN